MIAPTFSSLACCVVPLRHYCMRLQVLAVLLVVATALTGDVSAQVAERERRLELGLKAGIVNYQGDVQRRIFTAAGSNVLGGAFLRYSASPKLAVRASISVGKLSATDADNPELVARGFSFEAPMQTGEVTLEYLPLGKERFNNGILVSQLNPYVLAGVGFAHVKAEVSTMLANDTRFPEANDRDWFFTVPFGAGLRYDVAAGVAVGVEAIWRATFSDQIDGISVNGRADREDWFWTAGAYVSIALGSKGDDMGF